MNSIKVADYWPNPTDGKVWEFCYLNKDKNVSIISQFSKRNDTIYWKSFGSKGEWISTRFLKYDPARGVIEYRDEYPLTGLQKTIFGTSVKKIIYRSGQEILWGNQVSIGTTITNSYIPNYKECDGVFPDFPIADLNINYQVCIFEKLHDEYVDQFGNIHKNVLELVYKQKTNSGRYLLEKGLGPFEIKQDNDLITARISKS